MQKDMSHRADTVRLVLWERPSRQKACRHPRQATSTADRDSNAAILDPASLDERARWLALERQGCPRESTYPGFVSRVRVCLREGGWFPQQDPDHSADRITLSLSVSRSALHLWAEGWLGGTPGVGVSRSSRPRHIRSSPLISAVMPGQAAAPGRAT